MTQWKDLQPQILAGISGIATMIIMAQFLADISTGAAIFPVPVYLLATTLTLATTIPHVTGLPHIFRSPESAHAGLIILSSSAAWLLCLMDWVFEARSGASYAPLSVLPIFFLHIAKILKNGALSAHPKSHHDLDHRLPHNITPANPLVDEKPTNETHAGELLKVSAGAILPVDAVIVEGMGEIGGSSLIMRSGTRACGPGDTVFAGEKVVAGGFTIKATCRGGESLADKALAQMNAISPDPAFPDLRVRLRLYLALGIILSLTGMVLQSITTGLLAGIAVMLQVLSFMAPLGFALSYGLPLEWLGKSLKHLGAELHEPTILLKARHIKSVFLPVLDGFLRPVASVEKIVGSKGSEGEILSLAAGLFKEAQHPLAPMLEDACTARNLKPTAFTSVLYETGRGLVGDQGHSLYVIGNPALLAQHGISYRGLDDDLLEYELASDRLFWVGQARPIKSFLGVLVLNTDMRVGIDAMQKDFATSPFNLNGYAVTEPARLVKRVREHGVDHIIIGTAFSHQAKDYHGEKGGIAALCTAPLHAAIYRAADVRLVTRAAPSEMIAQSHISLRSIQPAHIPNIVADSARASRTALHNILISFLASLGGMIYSIGGTTTPMIAGTVYLLGIGLIWGNSWFSLNKNGSHKR